MEQTAAPPPQPPPLTTVTTDSFEEKTTNPPKTSPPQQQPPSQKLRLMCSYGGHIVPRPHDKTLCYVGGETRIVVVDRHTTLSNLTNRLSKTLTHSANSKTTPFLFNLKYQLPNEDLDSLISVTSDEDLENMIDEYERLNNNNLNNNSPNRLRLFLFPVQPEPVSVSSIGSLLESSTKSEDWFLNALNGTTSGFSDTSSSFNCLLGLDDDVLIPEQQKDIIISKSSNNNKSNNNNNDTKINNNNDTKVHDVQSVPDSPMMLETNSSFESESSVPNLPPIRVANVVEEQPAIVGLPVGSKGVISQPQQLPQPQPPQQQQYRFDMSSPDSVSSDGSVTNPLSRRNVIKPGVVYHDPVLQTQFSNGSSNSNISEQSNRIQMQPPPQFVHTAVPPPQPQYIHHHPSGAAVPVGSYYQMYTPQTHPPLDQHNFVYYMPATARGPPGPAGPTQVYSLPLQTDVSPAATAPPSSKVPPPSSLFTAPRAVTKAEPPVGVYRTVTTATPAPQLVHVPSSQHQLQPPYVGYSHIHQPALPVASSGGGGGNYAYEFTDPSKGQHIYYTAQPLPPQSVAQYQTMTAALPVEPQAAASVQTADNSVKQLVRTSQP